MKKLFVIMLVILISAGLFADKKEERSVFDVNPDRNQIISHSFSRDLFDLQFQIDVSETIAQGIAGVEYDGEYFYAAEWGYAGTDIHILDIDGNEVGSFTPTFVTGTGIRDMAWDGTYLYGSNASNTIYCFDTSGNLITSIPTPGSVRSIAYDSDLDGFWYNNFDTDLHFVDRSGTLLNTIPAPPSMYGCAYDNFSPGGPFLWLHTGTTTGGGAYLEQYDLATLTLTGVTHTVEAAGIAGGLFIADGIVAGKATIGALAQGTFIYGFELCDTAPMDSPGAPTDVTLTPDGGGALSADIDWTCPTLDVGGNALTDLDEMRVYRDGDLIYTDTTPTIGAAGSYSDAVVPAAGTHTYSVVGYNDAGEGIPAVVSGWIGEDVPDAVTDVVLTDVSVGGDLIAQLDWVNPTTGLHGGYFAGILGYDIMRSDGVPLVATGSLTTWQDATIVDPGVYSYTITPFNGSGSGPSTTSPQVGIGVSIVQVGNEEVGDYQLPQNLYWHNSIVETVYDYEWIGSDMLINTVSFHAANIGSAINDYNFEIWLGEIDIDDLSGGWIDASQLTLVFDGTISVPTGDYWLDIPLDTPFEYTYSHNLVMGTVKDDDEYYTTSDTWWTTESGTDSRSIHEYSDSDEFSIQTPPADINTKTTYPDVRFYYSPLDHGDVEGVVTDAVTSNPVAGAEVFVGAFGPVITSAAGEYLIEDVVIGTQVVTAFKEGYYDFVGSVDVLAGQVVTYDFVMDPNLFGILDGTVTDSDTGDPLIGADIHAVSLGGYEFDTVTDGTGFYEITDMVVDTYEVYCSFPDYPTGMETNVAIEDGITTTVDFALEGYTYWNDFETNDGGLISSDLWDWGAFTSGPMAGYSGTNGWATSIGGDYPLSSNSTLDTPMSYMIGAANAMLEFWHWYDIEASFDGGNVKISTDEGSSWNVIVPLTGYTGIANTSNPLDGEEIFCGHDQMFWELAQFDLSGYVGESVMFRWHFGSDSSVQYAGWYIDDVSLSGGTGGPVDPGYIEGTVVLADGMGDVEDVVVTAGGETTNPLSDGNYYIEIQPGTYDVTATLVGYDSEVIEGVVVTEGNATTGVNFEMFTGSGEIVIVATKLENNYPNPFNPVTNISYSVKEPGNVTIEIYNIKGQLVKTLVNEVKETGIYSEIWNSTDNSNKEVTSGIYFYKMKAGKYNSCKKMMLLK